MSGTRRPKRRAIGPMRWAIRRWWLGWFPFLAGCLGPWPEWDECNTGDNVNCYTPGTLDLDQDGFPAGQDCNDQDAAINPNTQETCDRRDENCDGLVDEGLADYREAVAFWQADGNAADALGRFPGQLLNGAGFAAGRVREGFAFDGIDDFASFGPEPGNFGTGDFTIEFWFRKPDDRYEGVMSKNDGCSSAIGLDLRMWSYIEVGVGTEAGRAVLQGGTYIGDNSWHHLGLVRQGADYTLYLDGRIEMATCCDASGALWNQAELLLGRSACRGVEGEVASFSGQLDEVTFYSRALTEGELRDIVALGDTPKCVMP